MQFNTLQAFTARAAQSLPAKGPVALVLLEDASEVTTTLEHLSKQGFDTVIAFGRKDLLPEAPNDTVHTVVQNMHAPGAMETVVNAAIGCFPNRWIFYCFNAEYLFFPFCETRSIREMTVFSEEERRHSILTFVIDLYSNRLNSHPDGVDPESAYLDRSGYYALTRFRDGVALDRQMDFFGGLRWRFEEHVPWAKRRIDRVGLFKAHKSLKLNPDHTFNDDEYNTYACPWHNNITATICSFRTAKALMLNPGSMHEIPHFWWNNSTKFDWHSTQLMQLGLMEPGQWF
ncbi:MAG: hypothetical protein AAGA12_12580 [Pseudomonadota bacterium]